MQVMEIDLLQCLCSASLVDKPVQSILCRVKSGFSKKTTMLIAIVASWTGAPISVFT